MPNIVKPARVVVPNPSVETENSDLVEDPIEKAKRSFASVLILKRDVGEDVPTPTKPLLFTINEVAVDEPMTNWLAASPAVGLTARVAHGVVVPTPTAPPAVAKYAEPLEVRAVVEAYGNAEAVVVVAVKYAATAWPTTESFAYGEVVPIPTLPVV